MLAPSEVRPVTLPEAVSRFDVSPNQSVADTIKQLAAKTSGYPDDNEWVEQSSHEGSDQSKMFYLHKSTHHPLAPMEEVSHISAIVE